MESRARPAVAAITAAQAQRNYERLALRKTVAAALGEVARLREERGVPPAQREAADKVLAEAREALRKVSQHAE